MLIDNELLNQMVRHGEGYQTLSSSPKLENIISEDGSFSQTSDEIPLMDALRSLVATAKSLHPEAVHPLDLVSLVVQRDEVEKLIVSLIRHAPAQLDLHQPRQRNPKKIAEDEAGIAVDAYKTAVEILNLQKNCVEKNHVLTFDRHAEALKKSKNPELTSTLLAEAGTQGPSWTSIDGKLPALKDAMPPTLPAKKCVTLTGKLTDVNSKLGVAKIEIESFQDNYSKEVLTHRTPDVELRFDNESGQLDDLLLLYYRGMSVPITANANCAIHTKHAKRAWLQLQEINLPRKKMDLLHTSARQMDFQFETTDLVADM